MELSSFLLVQDISNLTIALFYRYLQGREEGVRGRGKLPSPATFVFFAITEFYLLRSLSKCHIIYILIMILIIKRKVKGKRDQTTYVYDIWKRNENEPLNFCRFWLTLFWKKKIRNSQSIGQNQYLPVNLCLTGHFPTTWHCVKSVRIWSFSGPYFPAFELNTEIHGVNLRIQSECGKAHTRKTPNTDTFHVAWGRNYMQ